MRSLAITSAIFFGFTALSVFPSVQVFAQPNSGQRFGSPQRTNQQTVSGQTVSGQPLQTSGTPPWRQRGGQPEQPANNPRQTPSATNPDQNARTMARLRAMDTNGNGILETHEIPDNQRGRVNAMITQLGGDPNSDRIRLSSLERRATGAAAPGTGAPPSQRQPQQQSNQPPRQSQQPTQAGQENRRGRQPQPQQSAEPLVRAFGESRPAETPVLGFGQRAGQQPVQTETTQGRQPRGTQQANSASTSSPSNNSAVPHPAPAHQSSAYDSISPAVRYSPNFSWFFEYDTDRDAQLTMMEFVAGNGGHWTPQIASDFMFLDRNGDGFATVDEALASIREDEERRARESREQESVSGPTVRPGMERPSSPRNRPPRTSDARFPESRTPGELRPSGRNAPGNRRGAERE